MLDVIKAEITKNSVIFVSVVVLIAFCLAILVDHSMLRCELHNLQCSHKQNISTTVSGYGIDDEGCRAWVGKEVVIFTIESSRTEPVVTQGRLCKLTIYNGVPSVLILVGERLGGGTSVIKPISSIIHIKKWPKPKSADDCFISCVSK